MRSTPHRFLAAILLTASAGFALSQEAKAPPAQPAPAAASAAVKSAILETPAETGSRSNLIIGEWLLVGVLLVAFYGITQMLRRRPTRGRSGLIDLKSLELKPRPVTTRL